MPDRHWMEKWKWDHSASGATPSLVRRADGERAESWTHAAEIEGAQRGVSGSDMLTKHRYQMVPLKELYPPDVAPLPAPMRLGEGQEKNEQQAVALEQAGPGSAGERSRGMFVIGWVMVSLAALAFLISGDLLAGAILVLAFFGGAAIATHIARR